MKVYTFINMRYIKCTCQKCDEKFEVEFDIWYNTPKDSSDTFCSFCMERRPTFLCRRCNKEFAKLSDLCNHHESNPIIVEEEYTFQEHFLSVLENNDMDDSMYECQREYIIEPMSVPYYDIDDLKYPLSTYVDIFGGIYAAWYDLHPTREDLEENVYSSDYFLDATQQMDILLGNRLCGVKRIDPILLEWINSPLLDVLNKQADNPYYQEPIILVCDTLPKVGAFNALKFLLKDPTKVHMNDTTRIFTIACDTGHFEAAKLILETYPWISTHEDIVLKAFNNACNGGHLEIAKWLNTISSISGSGIEITLDSVCDDSYIEVAEWLLSTFPGGVNMYDQFFNACTRGRLEVAKWLSTFLPGNTLVLNRQLLIRICCVEHNHVAVWLLEKYPFLETSIDHNTIYHLCMYGKLASIKWILSIRPNIQFDLQTCINNAYEHKDVRDFLKEFVKIHR